MARWIAVLGLLVSSGCSPAEGADRTVVASIYPLAFAAERIAGPGWEIIDLTPPGVEAHDLELTLEQRSAIEEADVVVYLGPIGFQPQVEAAVEEANGVVVAAAEAFFRGGTARVDPHLWLQPAHKLGWMAARIEEGLGRAHPEGAAEYRRRTDALIRDLQKLDRRYLNALDQCESTDVVVSHEAFGWMLPRYGLEQHGLSGIVPDAEPTASSLQAAADLLRSEGATAIFYERSAEAERLARTVAADAGVEAYLLDTLESRPPRGDYLTVMEDNLDSLREGLRCR